MTEEIRDFHLNQWIDALKKFGKLAMTERLLRQLLPNADDRQNWINEVKMKHNCKIQEKDNTLYFKL
jgi:hypothetical protein